MMMWTTDKRMRRVIEPTPELKAWITAVALARLLDNCPPPKPDTAPIPEENQ